uniref:Secreted protein n=1 Tax=Bactrocera latifrons TaxID=174628 RepID=A0A0K8VNL8_BACLA
MFHCCCLLCSVIASLRTHTRAHANILICTFQWVFVTRHTHTHIPPHTYLLLIFSNSARQLFWLEYSFVFRFHFSSTHCLLPFLDVFDLLLRNGKPNNSVNGSASRMQQCKQ